MAVLRVALTVAVAAALLGVLVGVGHLMPWHRTPGGTTPVVEEPFIATHAPDAQEPGKPKDGGPGTPQDGNGKLARLLALPGGLVGDCDDDDEDDCKQKEKRGHGKHGKGHDRDDDDRDDDDRDDD